MNVWGPTFNDHPHGQVDGYDWGTVFAFPVVKGDMRNPVNVVVDAMSDAGKVRFFMDHRASGELPPDPPPRRELPPQKSPETTVLSDIDVVLAACRDAGFTDANDHLRRQCVGETVIAKGRGYRDNTVRCLVPSLQREIWFPVPALTKDPDTIDFDPPPIPTYRVIFGPRSGASSKGKGKGKARNQSRKNEQPRGQAVADAVGQTKGPSSALLALQDTMPPMSQEQRDAAMMAI